MKGFIAIVVFAASLQLAASQCNHFKCLNAKVATIEGVHVQCDGTRFCNLECRHDGLGFPVCLDTERVCPYDCDQHTIHLSGVNYPFQCPSNMECNRNKTSCNPCVPRKCETRDFICIDDITVFHKGVYGVCAKGTICNRGYEYPCTLCIQGSVPTPTKPSPTTISTSTPITTFIS